MSTLTKVRVDKDEWIGGNRERFFINLTVFKCAACLSTCSQHPYLSGQDRLFRKGLI